MWGGASRYLIVGLLFGVAGAGIFALHDSTDSEIRKIRMVRGEVPGARFTGAKVVSLDSQPGDSGGRLFLVRFRMDKEAYRRTVYEETLSRVTWSQLKEGARLKVAELANDPKPYLPSGRWASDENLEFKGAILSLERVGIGLFALAALFCIVRAFFVKPTPGQP